METRNITIVVPGADPSAQSTANDMTIQPGVTGRQAATQVGLNESYVLTKADGKPIDMGVDLFPLVSNGEKLFATTPAIVGQTLTA
jgi:hypothetical protein